MRSIVSKRVQQQINKRQYRARPIFFAILLTLALVWLELLYRWITTSFVLHSDVIHIAWINASIAFVFVFLLGFLPRSLHRLFTMALLLFFIVSFVFHSVLTASHIQYADLTFVHSWEMVDLYRRRYQQYVIPLLLAGMIPLLWGLFPMRLRRSLQQQVSLGLWSMLIVLVSFSYLTNPNYSNQTDTATNWEMLIYPDRPMASRNRVGIHQDAIQQLLNQPLFLRPVQENVLGDISNYLVNNNTIQGRSSYAFRGQNVIVFQIEGLRGEALNERVMPFLSKEIYPESIRFNEYYSDLKEINNYGVNFPLLTGIPLQENVNNTIESYRLNSFPHSLPNLFRQRDYATVAFHQFFSVPERAFIDSVGFDARFDYFSFPTWIDNDVEFVEASVRLLPKNQRFFAYYHFNNPHVQRGIPYINEFESWAGSKARAEYFSEMHHVDVAIEKAVDYLKANEMWENTVIMVVGMNPSLVDVNVTSSNRIANYNTPFFLYGKGTNQDIDQVMGPTDVIPSLMSMFAFKPDNYYLGRSVFSAGQNTISFRDGSWISNAGYYDSHMQRFVISDPIYRTDFLGTYIDMTTERMQERMRIGRLILERNFYAQEAI